VTDLITDFAIDWIKKRDPNKPFLLLYHHKAPHGNWQPAEQYKALWEDESLPHPETFDDDLSGRAEAIQKNNSRLNPELLKRWQGWQRLGKKPTPEGLSNEELDDWIYQQYVKDYLRVMKSVDDNVGRFLDFLEEAGLAENTMVIYTSDNGMFLGDHFLFDKRLMYEEPMRVPLAVRYPAGVKPGTDVSAFAVNVDYAPTILDYAGVAVPPDMQGRSLRPLLEGRTPGDWRKSFYYHYWEWPSGHDVAPHYGVRTQRFKLIHHYDERYGGPASRELIDLQSDPHEYRNVIDDPRYAETVAELETELERLRREVGAPEVVPQGLVE
jgi:arylsulfatase A-like enzyme